jgi:hypothetical protein
MGWRACRALFPVCLLGLLAATTACAGFNRNVAVSEEAQWLAGQMAVSTKQAQGGIIYPEDTVTFGLHYTICIPGHRLPCPWWMPA